MQRMSRHVAHELIEDDDFKPGFSGTIGSSAYERVTTERFAADDDDLFMRSVLANYI